MRSLHVLTRRVRLLKYKTRARQAVSRKTYRWCIEAIRPDGPLTEGKKSTWDLSIVSSESPAPCRRQTASRAMSLTASVQKDRLWKGTECEELTIDVVPGVLPSEDGMHPGIALDTPQETRFIGVGDELEDPDVLVVHDVP